MHLLLGRIRNGLFCLMLLLLSSRLIHANEMYLTYIDDAYKNDIDTGKIAIFWNETTNLNGFETVLNDSLQRVSMLDLNADGIVDSLRVLSYPSDDSLKIIIQAKLAPNIYVDLIALYTTKNGTKYPKAINNNDNVNIIYGDLSLNFNLQRVLIDFFLSNDLADFEDRLNLHSNLDIDNDGYIDRIFITEDRFDKKMYIISINAMLEIDKYQQIASIYMTNQNHRNKIEIAGSPYIYGNNYIIVPIWRIDPGIFSHIFWRHRPCFSSRMIGSFLKKRISTRQYIIESERFVSEHSSTIIDFVYHKYLSNIFYRPQLPRGHQYYADTYPNNSYYFRSQKHHSINEPRMQNEKTESAASEETKTPPSPVTIPHPTKTISNTENRIVSTQPTIVPRTQTQIDHNRINNDIPRVSGRPTPTRVTNMPHHTTPVSNQQTPKRHTVTPTFTDKNITTTQQSAPQPKKVVIPEPAKQDQKLQPKTKQRK